MPFAFAAPAVGLALDTVSHTTTSRTVYASGSAPALPGVSVPAWLGDARDKSADRRFALQEGARRLAGSKALDGCFRRRQYRQEVIQGVYYPERGSAGFKGIQTCGSRWACPVCAALLSELSRRELKAGIDAHEAKYGAGSVVMPTFTVPHYARQRCAEVLGSQQKKQKDGTANSLYGGLKEALHLFSGGRDGKSLYAEIGIVGTVRNLEVTRGDNGWHCHSHAAWFLDHVPTTAELQSHWLLARNRWLDCVEKAGIPVASKSALKKHGFDLRGDKEYIEDYIAKLGKETDWHMEHELAKGSVKQGKFGGRTPTQLLADYTFEGDQAAGVLWQEYAACYRGSKQLYWSKGLRARLGIGDREYTDEELMNIQATGDVPDWAKPPKADTIQDFNDQEWSAICADGVRGLCRALLRQAGETADRTAFDLWFAPYRVYDRAQKPVVPQVQRMRFQYHGLADRDDAPELEEGRQETVKRKTLSDLYGVPAYQNPLVSDPEALAMWPGLTSDQADRYLLHHAAYQAGDPFADRVPQLEYLARVHGEARETTRNELTAWRSSWAVSRGHLPSAVWLRVLCLVACRWRKEETPAEYVWQGWGPLQFTVRS